MTGLLLSLLLFIPLVSNMFEYKYSANKHEAYWMITDSKKLGNVCTVALLTVNVEPNFHIISH